MSASQFAPRDDLRRVSNFDALRRASEQMEFALAPSSTMEEAAWGLQLQSATTALYEAIERHRLAAESPAGTLMEMSHLKPALSRQIERQRREHVEMLHRAEELEEELERELAFQKLDVQVLHLQATVLLGILRLHLIHADRLFYEVYFQEEGGEQG